MDNGCLEQGSYRQYKAFTGKHVATERILDGFFQYGYFDFDRTIVWWPMTFIRIFYINVPLLLSRINFDSVFKSKFEINFHFSFQKVIFQLNFLFHLEI